MAGRFLPLFLLSLLGISFLTACQTVSRDHAFAGGGETYSREIVTEPSDAEISIDGTPIGKAPLTLSLTAPRYRNTADGPPGTIRDPFDGLRERGSAPLPEAYDPSYIEYRNALQHLHVLAIRKTGYADREITFSMENMQEAIPETITLKRSRAPAETESRSKTQEQTTKSKADSAETEDSVPEAIHYGYLTIVSEPTNAEVFVGNDLIGVTPLTHVLLEAGTHQVTLKHPEVKEWTYWVEILSRSTTTLHATMEK